MNDLEKKQLKEKQLQEALNYFNKYNNDITPKKIKKKYLWFLAKKISYDFLLYFTVCIIIGRVFGLAMEIVFILGGIYLQLYVPIRNLLMRIF